MGSAIYGTKHMVETECQQLIVDAAKTAGGQALKLNNRFLIGVADLLVKLPGIRPMWLEAKLNNFSAKTLQSSHAFDLAVTKLQKDFLRDWQHAGMLTGVVSFVQENGKGVKSLHMALYSYGEMDDFHWVANVIDHNALGGKDERMDRIVGQLERFAGVQ